MKFLTETILVGLGALVALLGVAFAADDLFRIHMWVLFAVLAIGTVLLIRKVQTAPAGGDDPNAYMDGPTRYGAIATLFWGVVGFLVGVIVAAQLAWPDFNIEPWLNFGRTRPLHTSAVIFAFGGNALLATSFYVVLRTCHTRLAGDIARVASSSSMLTVCVMPNSRNVARHSRLRYSPSIPISRP